MTRARDPFLEIRSRQRDLWLLFALVCTVLVGGLALSALTVEQALQDRFDLAMPGGLLYGGLLGTLLALLAWTWRKTSQLHQLIRGLKRERGRSEDLRLRLQTVHCILEACSHLKMEHDSGEGLKAILEEVAVGLGADRVVSYRVSQDGHSLQRDAVFPSSSTAPPRAILEFEDAVAECAVARTKPLILPPDRDPEDFGIAAPPPGEGFRAVAAAPLVLDDEARGVLVVRNPESLCDGTWGKGDRELLKVFASCAAGVLRNLRRFQASGRRIDELEREVHELRERRVEEVEVRTATTMTRIACSLAHSLSGPMTALRGYADAFLSRTTDASSRQRARAGIEAEQSLLRDRLQEMVDFTATWASRYELVDLGVAVAEALEEAGPSLRRHGIEVRETPYERLPLTMVDVPRLRLVLGALLRFARESLERGEAERTLHVRTLPQTGRVRLELRMVGSTHTLQDFGPLLEPNLEAHEMREPGRLDLAIASSIVRTHQGQLGVDLDGGQEPVLVLELPLRRDAPAPARHTFRVQRGRDPETAVEVLQEVLSRPRPAPAPAPAPRAPSSPPPTPAAGPAAAAGEPGATTTQVLEEMDLWGEIDAPPPPTPPPAKERDKRTAEPLLDTDSVESALRLFDEETS